MAILSRNFKIPEDNPYGDGLVELLDRMLTVDYKSRADMTEVILCLSAVYSGRPLPPRKKPPKPQPVDEEKAKEAASAEAKRSGGFFRTDGQGIRQKKVDAKKPVEVRQLVKKKMACAFIRVILTFYFQFVGQKTESQFCRSTTASSSRFTASRYRSICQRMSWI